jgi:protocatechuate 3,4-dioxygenase beta subunit
MYSSGVTAENYLRGVQPTASDGTATFVTVFPGCYSGRWPHVHFEIYRSTNSASSWTNKLRTSQLALPEDACSTVYNGSSLYSASVSNLRNITLASDNVFSDGTGTQMATVTGSLSAGFVARLQVGIAA